MLPPPPSLLSLVFNSSSPFLPSPFPPFTSPRAHSTMASSMLRPIPTMRTVTPARRGAVQVRPARSARGESSSLFSSLEIGRVPWALACHQKKREKSIDLPAPPFRPAAGASAHLLPSCLPRHASRRPSLSSRRRELASARREKASGAADRRVKRRRRRRETREEQAKLLALSLSLLPLLFFPPPPPPFAFLFCHFFPDQAHEKISLRPAAGRRGTIGHENEEE